MSNRLLTTLTRFGGKLFAIVLVLALLSAALPPSAAFAESTVIPVFTLEKVGTKLTVTVSDAQKNSVYFVKVDDASKSGYTWTKIGVLETDKYADGEGTYILPNNLRKVTDFNICLKNTETDDLICSVTILTVIRGEEEGSSSNTQKGTFTATRQENDVRIKTSNFPKNSAYFVKAAEKTFGAPTWYMLGSLKTKQSPSKTYFYRLPKQLRTVEELNVCLKNAITNELSCVLSQ